MGRNRLFLYRTKNPKSMAGNRVSVFRTGFYLRHESRQGKSLVGAGSILLEGVKEWLPNPCAAGPIPAGGTNKIKGLWQWL